MIKVQKGTASLILIHPDTHNVLVWYAPGDDMIEVFKRAYIALKCNIESRNVKKC